MTRTEYNRRHLAARNAYITGLITWEQLEVSVQKLNQEAGLFKLAPAILAITLLAQVKEPAL